VLVIILWSVADGTQSPRQCVYVCVCVGNLCLPSAKVETCCKHEVLPPLPFSAHSPSVLRFIIGFEYNGIVMKCAANDGLQTVGGSVASRVLRLPLDSGPRVLRLRYWNDDSPPVLHRSPPILLGLGSWPRTSQTAVPPLSVCLLSARVI